MVTGKETPERSAQDDVMKQKVTELLMTLGHREQAVSNVESRVLFFSLSLYYTIDFLLFGHGAGGGTWL